MRVDHVFFSRCDGAVVGGCAGYFMPDRFDEWLKLILERAVNGESVMVAALQ